MGQGHREVAWLSRLPGTAPDGPRKHKASGCEDWEPGTLKTPREPPLRSPSEKQSASGARRPQGPACVTAKRLCEVPLRQGPCRVPWAQGPLP